jgi:hypothetical protein
LPQVVVEQAAQTVLDNQLMADLAVQAAGEINLAGQEWAAD